MIHVCAYTNTALGTVVDTDIAALTDDILIINNSHFILPKDVQLLAAYVGSATLIRAKLSSPSLRKLTEPQIRPVNVGATPVANPNVMWEVPNIDTLKRNEELQVKATAAPATTEPFTAVLWLSDGIQGVPGGQVFFARATSTTTAVANAWTSITYTLDTNLPPGWYGLISSEVISTNGIAHRWINDQFLWRPGFLSSSGNGNRGPSFQYNGRWGMQFQFINTSLPRLQVLANGADASHTIFMQLVPINLF